MTAIVWIRRSMREHDNTALVEASRAHDRIIPVYIIDEDYFSKQTLGYPRVKFWHDSLAEFRESMEEKDRDLVVRKGKPVDELEKIIEETGADELYFNRDYSPYARDRDHEARKLDAEVRELKDLVMFDRKEITTNKGGAYQVYSYYRDKWFDREKPRPANPGKYGTPDIESSEIPSVEELGYDRPENLEWTWEPGREGGKKRLEQFREKISEYDEDRDYPAKDATSKLSPHLKFGTISVREAFWAAEGMKARGASGEGVRVWQEELAWRDFYFQLLWHFPRTVEEPFQEQYSSIEWGCPEENWQRFIQGKTGFPFIDAGMRQLRDTGWMHNRLRMAATSFAAKDLKIDWRKLHGYYSRMFVDAELASMIGGIQWAYSIGTDAQPYFRVFNPWTQGEKWDPDGEYIREHVPELRDVPDEYIHRPQEMPSQVQEETGVRIGEDYPEPLVDHAEERESAIKMFENARE
ncbi:MAG: deoxyribodipyrimidine photo-lyase [Candidatus Nanohaloarchaea archaeon]